MATEVDFGSVDERALYSLPIKLLQGMCVVQYSIVNGELDEIEVQVVTDCGDVPTNSGLPCDCEGIGHRVMGLQYHLTSNMQLHGSWVDEELPTLFDSILTNQGVNPYERIIAVEEIVNSLVEKGEQLANRKWE